MASEKFFGKHLGGKYQEGGTAEEVARLKEITVDPKTVVLARKIDARSIGAPKPATDLQAGNSNYQVKIEKGGQQVNMKPSTSLHDGASSWTATHPMDTPQSAATHTATLGKQSLLLLKRK